MTFEDFSTIMRPKTIGTRNLIQALEKANVETFLMLSSCVNIVGGEGQANYSAGNGYLDAIAQNQARALTRYISLNLGMIDDTDHTVDLSSRQKLARQGVTVVSVGKVLELINYALGSRCAGESYKQLVYGLDQKIIPNWILSLSTGNALFSHMLPTTGSNSAAINTESDDFVHQLASVAHDCDASCSIITKSVITKVASLVSMSALDIKVTSSIVDLGLDSLVTIQLRNWIRATFEAFFQPGDIVKARTIERLSKLIYESSDMVQRSIGSKHAK
jgi:aryl carrier-like protein